jgi:hypothetical protein
MELRKEFEKKYFAETNAIPYILNQFNVPQPTNDFVDWIIKQTLSKQVTEEEFRKFVFDIAKQIPDDFDESTYICNEIFSHYILIPKE